LVSECAAMNCKVFTAVPHEAAKYFFIYSSSAAGLKTRYTLNAAASLNNTPGSDIINIVIQKLKHIQMRTKI